jgi:hypothetical protein
VPKIGDKNVRSFKASPFFSKALTAILDGAWSGPALNQAEPVAPVWERLTYYVVHQGPHQKDATAAHSQFTGIQLGNVVQIKGVPLVKKCDFHGVRAHAALNLKRPFWLVAMGVADNVSDRFACGQDDRLDCWAIDLSGLADSLDEGADHRKHPWITWCREGRAGGRLWIQKSPRKSW